MRVALVGDVHANLPALEAVLADAREQGAEAVWNVGDFVGYGAFPDQVVRRLREVEAASILGNYDRKVLQCPRRRHRWRGRKASGKFLAFQWAHDRLSADSRAYLAGLPRQFRMRVAGWRILLCHGSSESDKEHVSARTPARRLRQLAGLADADVVVCGHTHLPFRRRVDGVWIINTGSVGRPEGGDRRACYALLDIGPEELAVEHRRVDGDPDRAAEAIRAAGLPEAFAQMVLRGRSLDEILADSAGDCAAAPDDAAVLAAAEALAESCHYEEGHSRQVTALALRLFDELGELHGLGADERRYLHWAGLLHDIGWVDGRQGHHKSSQRLILAAGSLPFDDRVRRIVASVARYHRKALPGDGHGHFAALPPADRRIVRMLAAILRIADGLDRTHCDVVRSVRCRVAPDRVVIACFATGPATAEVEAAREKADLFVGVFGRAVAFDLRRAARSGPQNAGVPGHE